MLKQVERLFPNSNEKLRNVIQATFGLEIKLDNVEKVALQRHGEVDKCSESNI